MRASTVAALLVLCVSRWAASTVAELADVTAGTFDGRELLQKATTTQKPRPTANAGTKAPTKQQKPVKQAGRNLLSDDDMQIEGRALLQAKQDTKKSTGNKKPSADTKKETGAKKGPSTQAAPGRHLLQTPQVAAPQPRQQGANNNFNPQRKAKVTAGRRLLSGSDKKPKQPKGATTKKPSSKTTQATKRP